MISDRPTPHTNSGEATVNAAPDRVRCMLRQPSEKLSASLFPGSFDWHSNVGAKKILTVKFKDQKARPAFNGFTT